MNKKPEHEKPQQEPIEPLPQTPHKEPTAIPLRESGRAPVIKREKDDHNDDGERIFREKE